MNSRHFNFYFFEDFDPETQYPLNPRKILTPSVDGPVSMAAAGCRWDSLCAAGGEEQVVRIEACGLLRRDGDEARPDAPALSKAFIMDAECLADRLTQVWPEIVRLAEGLDNGFDPQTNLYHIICGMVLDGALFDALCETGVVATSRAMCGA